MKKPFDADSAELHTQVTWLKMRAKSTDELMAIWQENDATQWEIAELEATQKILVERLGKLPEQKHKRPTPSSQSVKSASESFYWPFKHPIEQLSRDTQGMLFLFIVCFWVLVIVLSSLSAQSTNAFLEFSQTLTPAEIERIEIQGINKTSDTTATETIIAITDSTQIEIFVAALRKIEKSPNSRPPTKTRSTVTVKLWLTDNQTIELKCYTVETLGNTIFVDTIRITNKLSYWAGDAKFTTPEFYDWLVSSGFTP